MPASLRNPDFPQTYISSIQVDLTSPNHWVRLTWAGPNGGAQPTGPYHSTPGRGTGANNCDDVTQSNQNGSNCTPKGTKTVEGFADQLPSYPACKFVTWFQQSRGIAFHSHTDLPNYPASHGCVRLDAATAQLIHDNAKAGVTSVHVTGTWTAPPSRDGN